jgi:hypothetical protein
MKRSHSSLIILTDRHHHQPVSQSVKTTDLFVGTTILLLKLSHDISSEEYSSFSRHCNKIKAMTKRTFTGGLLVLFELSQKKHAGQNFNRAAPTDAAHPAIAHGTWPYGERSEYRSR